MTRRGAAIAGGVLALALIGVGAVAGVAALAQPPAASAPVAQTLKPAPTAVSGCGASGDAVDQGPREYARGEVGYNDAGQVATYTVHSGDALVAIAERFCLQAVTLGTSNNRFGAKSIQPGDVLALRAGVTPDPNRCPETVFVGKDGPSSTVHDYGPARNANGTPILEDGTITGYKVAKDDTLIGVSGRFCILTANLLYGNRLDETDGMLQIGQVLDFTGRTFP